MTIGYYPDHSYRLRRMNDDDCLDPGAPFYLHGQDFYSARQLRLGDPSERFEGAPLARVILNANLLPYPVMAGTERLGEIDLSRGIFTAIDDQRFWLEPIQL